MKALDYIPGPLGAVALIISIGGSTFTWSQSGESGGLTPIGWAAVALGAIALVSSLWLTWRRHRELDEQARRREHLKEIAQAEVALAVRHVTQPFYSLSSRSHQEPDPDSLGLVWDFWSDPKDFERAKSDDIRTPTPHRHDAEMVADFYRKAAIEGGDRIDAVMQIYAPYLDVEVLEVLSDLRRSEYMWRLMRLDEHVSMNSDHSIVECLSVPLPFEGYDYPRTAETEDRMGFWHFWDLVERLEGLLTAVDPISLRRRF